MTERPESSIAELQAWYDQMGSAEREELLQALSDERKALPAWWEGRVPEKSKQALIELDRYLTKQLKEQAEETVRQQLSELGLKAADFAGALFARAMKELRFYHDAAYLRQVSLEQFEDIVAKVIGDYFVERRYISWSRRSEYLGLDGEQAARPCYLVVINLVQTFYDRNVPLEVIESFMIEELAFDASKAKRFAELIVRNKEALDRHFLLQRLAKLSQQLTAVGQAQS